MNPSTKDMQNLFSEVVQFLWEMSTLLNRKKNHTSDFSNLYFLSYSRYCTENSSKIANFEHKNDHISKIKSQKSDN